MSVPLGTATSREEVLAVLETSLVEEISAVRVYVSY